MIRKSESFMNRPDLAMGRGVLSPPQISALPTQSEFRHRLICFFVLFFFYNL